MSDSTNAAQTWNAVAEAWATHTDELDGPQFAVTAALLARVAVQPGDRVLELAAEPGTLGPTWSQLVGPNGKVVMSDIAPAMVEVCRRRNATLDNVETAVIDASSIDRPNGSFDVVACRMGLMFTVDREAAFSEVFRVLRPKGRLAALTWGALDRNPWLTCVGMAAMANGLVAGGPPVGPGAIFSLGDPAVLERLADGAGFVDVAVEAMPVTFLADTVDEHIDSVSTLAGPLAAALQTASPDQLAAFRRTASDLAAPYLTDDGLEIPGQALLVSGRR